MRRSRILIAMVALLACNSEQASYGYPVDGQILLPAGHSLTRTQVVVTLDGGEERVGFPRLDGKFTVNDVPPGAHSLQVIAIQCCVFHQIRLDVGVDGTIKAAFAEAPVHRLPIPLVLKPAAAAEYFDKVVPFNLVGFLKSPMGLMAMGMVFVMLILPQMKVDPAEYQAMLKDRAGEAVEEAPVEAAVAVQAVAAGRGAQQRGSGPRRRA